MRQVRCILGKEGLCSKTEQCFQRSSSSLIQIINTILEIRRRTHSEQDYGERLVGSGGWKNWTWANNVRWHPGLHQEKSREMILPFYSVCEIPPVSSSGVSSIRGIWLDLLDQVQRNPQRWSEDWSTSLVKTGQECWGCSALRAEGSRETLLWPYSTWKGLTKKRESDFLHG